MRFINITNDCVLEVLVAESTYQVVILDMVLSMAQALVQDVDVVAPIDSSGHNAIKFSKKRARVQ